MNKEELIVHFKTLLDVQKVKIKLSRLWFHKHCGKPMVKIKVYVDYGDCTTHDNFHYEGEWVKCSCSDCTLSDRRYHGW